MIHTVDNRNAWDKRYAAHVAKQETKPTPKKRGPKPGTKMQGRPPGETINRGTVMKKPLGAIVMYMMGTP